MIKVKSQWLSSSQNMLLYIANIGIKVIYCLVCKSKAGETGTTEVCMTEGCLRGGDRHVELSILRICRRGHKQGDDYLDIVNSHTMSHAAKTNIPQATPHTCRALPRPPCSITVPSSPLQHHAMSNNLQVCGWVIE